MANATFVRNYILRERSLKGPTADSFKFCWSPARSAVQIMPHKLMVTAMDRFCPNKAIINQGINISVG